MHACLRKHRKEISEGCRREEMLLEQQEAEHIELRPNLLKACADERQTFCRSVQAGSGRVFRCVVGCWAVCLLVLVRCRRHVRAGIWRVSLQRLVCHLCCTDTSVDLVSSVDAWPTTSHMPHICQTQLALFLPLPILLTHSSHLTISAPLNRCLAEKLADPDFGQKCRTEVITKLQRR